MFGNDFENFKSLFIMYKITLKHDYNNPYSILIVCEKKYRLLIGHQKLLMTMSTYKLPPTNRTPKIDNPIRQTTTYVKRTVSRKDNFTNINDKQIQRAILICNYN